MTHSSRADAHVVAALAQRYRVELPLGEGGMATVYLAEDLKHDRMVAVKVLKPELAAALGAERFLHEIRVTARLQHPHILPLFDSGEAEGLLYYVMPYVEGENLRDRIKRHGQLPVSDALAIIGDVAAALTAAHAAGIVHRDIKPENILVRDGEGLVADFGIALAISLAGRERLTATGLSLGTPSYMSPEQVSGEREIDGRSDVYSLGCVLYEALTGEAPFTGPTMQAVVAKTLTQPAPSARAHRPDVPPQTDAAIRRAMAKQPDERFDTPRAFVEACTPPAALRPRSRAAMLVAAAAIVAAVAVAYPLWRGNQTARARASLPRIAALAEQGEYVAAYELAVAAERRLDGDTALARLMAEVSDRVSIETEPPGARVFVQRVGDSDSTSLGTTPLQQVRVPRADYRLRVVKDGYAPAQRMVSSALARAEPPLAGTVQVQLVLSPSDSVPPDMVPVPGGEYQVVSSGAPVGLKTELAPFHIDRFEITNRRYADFIKSGGYENPALWHGVPAGAARLFFDRTGLRAPRDWTNQEFPRGMERHPVTGITWYEAHAFCRASGGRLPTIFEWEKAARDGLYARTGIFMPWGFTSAATQVSGRANFSSEGTFPVDSLPNGMSPYGAYAMAGNVKEWLANPAGDGFVAAGGSWQDPAYLFGQIGALSAATARADVGFRCVRVAGNANNGAAPLKLDALTPHYSPVDAATFATILTHYRYDQRPPNARGIERSETADWVRERLWIDGVNGDSVLVYLYLPKRAAPPFQTIVYSPSTQAYFFRTIASEVEQFQAPHIKAGRALLAVVLKGMLERPQAPGFSNPPSASVRFRDLMVLQATELRHGIDYLATREDIDMQRLAYLGVSRGAGSRLPFAAVDSRYRSVVLIGAGIDERLQPTVPEAANYNFAPYIKQPKLVVNGRADEEHPWLTRALPLWNLLREPKELVLFDDAGHVPPAEQRVPPINAFLDRTLGPVTSR
jgi:eukaryotic-like serine/threonine-protein kinase